MVYVVAAFSAILLICLWEWQRQRTWRRRERALYQLLDGADELEAQLHDYRQRMTTLRQLLVRLPSDMTAPAMASIDPETQVRRALRDVLAHRLWIKKEGATATQDALDQAVEALNRSREQIAEQLKMLHEVGQQLEQAGQGLRSAYQEASAAMQALPRPEGSGGGSVPGSNTRH